LTALSDLNSLASVCAAIAKTINNARMAKEDMEEKKEEKEEEKKIISLLPNRPLSNIDIIHLAKKYIPHFRGVFMRDLLPEAPIHDQVVHIGLHIIKIKIIYFISIVLEIFSHLEKL